MNILVSYELGKNDVFLPENTGSTACPAFYHHQRSWLRATPEFGACSYTLYPTFGPKAGMIVSMVGFRGQLAENENPVC